MSADDSVASGVSGASGLSDAFSVDAASYHDSTKGTSAKASSLKAEYVFIGDSCCRVHFTPKGTIDLLVCGNAAPRGRHGHAKVAMTDGTAPTGFYKPKANQRFLDGVARQ